MSIRFIETELKDGHLSIQWVADTSREWNRVLKAIKKVIPREGRIYVPEYKAWKIKSKFRDVYEVAKDKVINEDDQELLDEIDFEIREDAILNSFRNTENKLPPSIRARALYCAKAVLGIIDVPFDFSTSKGLFGAYEPESKSWYFEDGEGSDLSPEEWDEKTLSEGRERIRRAKNFLEYIRGNMDTPIIQSFRHVMLEKYDYQCYVCYTTPRSLTKLHMHRVLPGRLGGEYIEENVVIVCSGCHKGVEGLSWQELKEIRIKNGN